MGDGRPFPLVSSTPAPGVTVHAKPPEVAPKVTEAHGVKVTEVPPAESKLNPWTGLKEGKDGLTFPDGQKVDGVNNLDYNKVFKGPLPAPNVSENPAAMRIVDIVQSQGNGHIGNVWPYREDTTGHQQSIVNHYRQQWKP